MPGTELIFPMSSPATAAMGARSSGGLRNVNMMPWFEDRNAAFPVMVNAVTTLGSAWSTWSARFWSCCICSGDEPSRAMKTPKITLLSPTGRNALGTIMNSQTVPRRQTTQIAADTARRRRNHQSDRP